MQGREADGTGQTEVEGLDRGEEYDLFEVCGSCAGSGLILIGSDHDAFMPGYLTLVDCPRCNGSGLILRKVMVTGVGRGDTGEVSVTFEYVGEGEVDELED